jgi:hypothetical protein
MVKLVQMKLTEEQKQGLGVALNEATLLGLEVDPQRRVAGATFSVFTLPEEGPAPEDTRVQMLFEPVGRLAASLRLGHWDDSSAEVVTFSIEELLAQVQSFGGLPVYGWEFFDVHEKDFPKWNDRLSIDCRSGEDGQEHTISLFQEGDERHLDICLWFDDFRIRNASGNEITLVEFIAGGTRWWNAFYAKDPRTQGKGMYSID